MCSRKCAMPFWSAPSRREPAAKAISTMAARVPPTEIRNTGRPLSSHLGLVTEGCIIARVLGTRGVDLPVLPLLAPWPWWGGGGVDAADAPLHTPVLDPRYLAQNGPRGDCLHEQQHPQLTPRLVGFEHPRGGVERHRPCILFRRALRRGVRAVRKSAIFGSRKPCRRRDSNPRRADYDPTAPFCGCLRLIENLPRRGRFCPEQTTLSCGCLRRACYPGGGLANGQSATPGGAYVVEGRRRQ